MDAIYKAKSTWAGAPVISSHAGLYAAGNLPKAHDAKPNPKPDPAEPKANPSLQTPPPAHSRAYSFDSAWRLEEAPTPTDKDTPGSASSIPLGFSPGSADTSTTSKPPKPTTSPKKASPKKVSPKKGSPSSKTSNTPSPSKNSDLSGLSKQSPTENPGGSNPSLKRARSEVSVSSSKLAKFDKYYYRFLGLQLALRTT